MEMRDYLAAEDKQFRAHLEEHRAVIGGVLGEVKAQGGRIAQETAQAVKASGKEAVAQAQASLDQVAQAAQKVEDLAQRTSETTAKAAQRSEEILGRLEQASQRMVTSEEKVEAALDALVPKVAGVREKLEKELGDVVNVTAATEAEIQRMVAAIRTSMTKEIEKEIREKLHEAANQTALRIYNLGSWWDNFTRFGIYVVMGICMVATGILGWYFGRHQVEEGIYAKTLAQVKANAEVRACAYQFHEDLNGVMQPKFVGIDAPLVWTAPGKFALMTKNEQGQWVYGKALVNPGVLLSAACWDASIKDKDQNTIKTYCP